MNIAPTILYKKIEDLHQLGAFMNCRAESEVQALWRELNLITEKIDDLADLMLRGASST
jgi:hypothetical protein